MAEEMSVPDDLTFKRKSKYRRYLTQMNVSIKKVKRQSIPYLFS